MGNLRKQMINNACAYNSILTKEYFSDKSDKFILANTYPDDRVKFDRILKEQAK